MLEEQAGNNATILLIGAGIAFSVLLIGLGIYIGNLYSKTSAEKDVARDVKELKVIIEMLAITRNQHSAENTLEIATRRIQMLLGARSAALFYTPEVTDVLGLTASFDCTQTAIISKVPVNDPLFISLLNQDVVVAGIDEGTRWQSLNLSGWVVAVAAPWRRNSSRSQ